MSAASAPSRSYLFVPGSRPDRFGKALATRAHVVIIDLEDAVAVADKAKARAAISDAVPLARHLFVRINAAGTPWFDDDVAMCRRACVAGIVLPKAEDASTVDQLAGEVGDRTAILPLLETARGLWHASAIARAQGVARLLFGSIDFQLDLGLRDEELIYYRSQLVLVSRVADLPAPVDGVTTAIDDIDALTRDIRRARTLGFGGKLCIHPKQVGVVNAAFRPAPEEIAWAERVVAANGEAKGAAAVVDGKMVDRPILLVAHNILAEAEKHQDNS